MTRVVNLRAEPFDVYIGRAGKGRDGYFGNPFKMPFGFCTREIRADVINRYYVYFHERLRDDAEFRGRVEALRGKVLGCFCKPKPCHGDVIAAYLDGAA